MRQPDSPPRPNEPDLPAADSLEGRVRQALYALPAHFRSTTSLEGLPAPDLQTLSTMLGAAIEDQVVATLNSLRTVWDPEGEFGRYYFRRQAQTFPDVLLMADENGRDIRLGIELKGWFLLAKEKAPNFRFQATAAACAAEDLICVVPWHLNNVMAGVPVVAKPFLIRSRHAAEYRNWWWAHGRTTSGNTAIEIPEGVEPYPDKKDRILDKPVSDSGNNFGRLARTHLMDAYIDEMLDLPLAGIAAKKWIQFLAGAQS